MFIMCCINIIKENHGVNRKSIKGWFGKVCKNCNTLFYNMSQIKPSLILVTEILRYWHCLPYASNYENKTFAKTITILSQPWKLKHVSYYPVTRKLLLQLRKASWIWEIIVLSLFSCYLGPNEALYMVNIYSSFTKNKHDPGTIRRPDCSKHSLKHWNMISIKLADEGTAVKSHLLLGIRD